MARKGCVRQRAQRAVEVPPDWRTRATVSVDQYAQIVGIHRNTAYEAVRAGEVPVIRVRDRILVCVPPLLRQIEGTAPPAP